MTPRGAPARQRRTTRREVASTATTATAVLEAEGVDKAPDPEQPDTALVAVLTARMDCECGHAYTDHLGDDGPCRTDSCDCTAYAVEDDSGESAAADGEEFAASEVEEALPAEHQPSEAMPPRRQGPVEAVPVQRTNASQMRWEATFAPEGKATDDGRLFAPGSISWRELPLTLMAQLETAEGHDGAQVAGRIDNIWRDGSMIRASGVFDDSEFASEVARMVGEGVLRGLSVDIAIKKYEVAYESDVLDEHGNWKEPSADEEGSGDDPDQGGEGEGPSLIDLLFGPDEAVIFVVTDGVIGAATVCSFPAFADAEISLSASGAVWTIRLQGGFTVVQQATDVVEDEILEAAEAVTAAAAGLAPVEPPSDWFHPPQFDELTPMTVDEDGHIYGHAAAWDTCHLGIPDVCTTAPHSETDYVLFHLAEVLCDDGERVACGKVTLGTSHADRRLGWKATVEHYDNTGTAVADVIVGEDEFGIWMTGAVRPTVSAERVRELRGSVLSGDWRDLNGSLELVALLAVNVPGFPVPRPRALIAAGEDGNRVLALVAAGVHDGHARVLTAAQVARLAGLGAVATGGLGALVARATGTDADGAE